MSITKQYSEIACFFFHFVKRTSQTSYKHQCVSSHGSRDHLSKGLSRLTIKSQTSAFLALCAGYPLLAPLTMAGSLRQCHGLKPERSLCVMQFSVQVTYILPDNIGTYIFVCTELDNIGTYIFVCTELCRVIYPNKCGRKKLNFPCIADFYDINTDSL